MIPLTDQQQAAVDVSGASVVLATGAGCGKTRVLAAKYLERLESARVPVERLVALTFTDKAAAELRKRVRDECRKRLDAGDEPEYWREVLRKLEAAPIGTFHTFCGELVRRHAIRAGVDPGFTILDESIAATCREEAVDTTIRRALVARDADLGALVAAIELGPLRDHLVTLLGDRSSESLGRWGEVEPAALVETWRGLFVEKAQPAVIARFRRAVGPCLDLIEARRDDFPPKLTDNLARIVGGVAEIERSGRPEDLLQEVGGYAKVQGVPAKQWSDADLYETCKVMFESFRKEAKRALERLASDEASTEVAAALGVALARLAAKARAEFAGVKRRRGALDFDDLLVLARDLLRDDSSGVRDDLVRRCDLILVDEFQDTDPVQDEVVRRVAGDDLAAGRVFLVGDSKQSIYGFRGARPALFERYRRELPEAGRLPLTENFRSRRGVIEFVNVLFEGAFLAYEPIEAKGDDRLDPSSAAVVFAWPLEGPSAEKTARKDLRGQEAVRLARLVRAWIDEGRLVRDVKTEGPRPMRAGDVAFLFRTLNDSAAYQRALADEGLEYYVVGGSALYAQGEVQDLINVLTVLDDPHDSLALAGALRSPFFGVSDEGLYWLSTARRGDLTAGLAACAELSDMAESDRERASRAHEMLSRWRGRKDREPIARLVERVLEESGFEAAVLGEPLGDRKRANARKLVRMARAFDEAGGFALADFVARLRADLRTPPREEQAATTGELGDVVRLMTVHKAKGLEFPVVVLPDLDRRSDSPRSRVALHDDLGPLLNITAEDDETDAEAKGSVGWLVHRRLAEVEERDEALRVFYVATTRARDLLVLSTSGEPRGDERAPALRLLAGRFDVSTGACRREGGPRVEVIRALLERSGGRARAKRPALRAMARAIESGLDAGEVATAASPARSPGRPARLSLDPADYVPGAAARLDGLVRAIGLDGRVGRMPAEHVAAEVARRQTPMAPARMTEEAVARIRAFAEGPLGHRVAKARESCRDLAWSTVREETTIEGRLDLAFRDEDDAWVLVQFESAGTPERLMRARLALAARLAPGLGCGPIARGWIVVHGPGGGLRGEDRFDEETTAALVAAVLGDRSERRA